MDINNDIVRVNKKLNTLTKKQEELTKSINSIIEDKKKLIYKDVVMKRENKTLKRLEKVSDELIPIFSGDLSLKELDGKLLNLYKKSFKRIVPKRIQTKAQVPDDSGVYCYDDKDVYLNIKGIGIVEKSYWSKQKRTHYIEYLNGILKIIKNCPSLSRHIKNKTKKKVYKMFKDGTKDWIMYINDEIIYSEKNTIPIIKYNEDRNYGVSEVCSDSKDNIDVIRNNNGILIKLSDKGSYHWNSFQINLCREWNEKEKLVLSLLPESVVKKIEEDLETLKVSYKNNKDIYEKLEKKLFPYIAMDLI